MNSDAHLKTAERKIFQTVFQDGLIEIGLACFFSLFALAPFLSVSLGDFWSSAIFLPFWGLVYLAVRLIRRNWIQPRIGRVKFGSWRKARLRTMNILLVAVNVIALAIGVYFAFSTGGSGWMPAVIFGGILLVAFSTAAIFLNYPFFYLYGLLFGASPLVGEWLYRNAGASHHGYPVTYGAVCSLLLLIGLVKLIRILVQSPLKSTEKG